jgi:hypothetical protein
MEGFFIKIEEGSTSDTDNNFFAYPLMIKNWYFGVKLGWLL